MHDRATNLENAILDEDAAKFAVPCGICGKQAEIRFNLYNRNVWACGCWCKKDNYAASPNRNDAIKAWNAIGEGKQ